MQDHIVRSYDCDLRRLQELLTSMGDLVQQQLQSLCSVLQAMDGALSAKIIQSDSLIDRLEVEIGELVMRVLVLRQPVAWDLRFVLAAVKASSNLERIGDYASHIAGRVISLGSQQEAMQSTPSLLQDIMEKVHQMMVSLFQGSLIQDSSILGTIWECDVEVDGLYQKLLENLLTQMVDNSQHVNIFIHWLFIAKNIERIGDHLTNIAETLYVLIQGHPLPTVRPRRP